VRPGNILCAWGLKRALNGIQDPTCASSVALSLTRIAEGELDPHQAVEDRTPDHVKIEILRDNEGVKLHLQQLTWTPSLLQSTYLAAGSTLSSALSVSNSTLAPTSGKRLLKGRSTGLKGYIGALREQKALISIHQGNIAEGDIPARQHELLDAARWEYEQGCVRRAHMEYEDSKRVSGKWKFGGDYVGEII